MSPIQTKKEMILFWYPRPVWSVGGEGSVFWWDDHHRVTILWPPQEHLCIIGVGLDHGVGGNGLILAQDLRLFLGYGFFKNSPLTQRFLWVHMDVKTHPPANRLQDQSLCRGLVYGYQPRGEALIPVDAAKLRHITVADGYAPCHTGVEVVIHANCEFAVLFGGAYNSASLSGVSIPRVVDAIRVADGLNFSIPQIRKLPTRHPFVAILVVELHVVTGLNPADGPCFFARYRGHQDARTRSEMRCPVAQDHAGRLVDAGGVGIDGSVHLQHDDTVSETFRLTPDTLDTAHCIK